MALKANLLALVLAAAFLPSLAHSQTPPTSLAEANITDDIKSFLPHSSFVAGDRSWSGGMINSAFVQSTSFDANSSYSIFSVGKYADKETPATIARKILDGLISKYNLPTEAKPPSTWDKKVPKGVDPGNFAEVYLASYFKNKDDVKMGLYLTIQVVRLDGGKFGITTSYSLLK